MTILHKFYRLPAYHRRLLLEAGWRLLSARAAVALLPFSQISPTLGTIQTTTTPQPSLSGTQQETAKIVRWAIAEASQNLPIRTACLHQAITAKYMLSKRGIPNTLYLGTRKKSGELAAHAWVISGNIGVTGTQGHEPFTVISTFL